MPTDKEIWEEKFTDDESVKKFETKPGTTHVKRLIEEYDENEKKLLKRVEALEKKAEALEATLNKIKKLLDYKLYKLNNQRGQNQHVISRKDSNQ